MSLFSQHMRDLWKEWEVRLLVILSLFLQILLLWFGRRRKSTSNVASRALVWCTYLTAESVAAYGLALLSNRVASVQQGSCATPEWDPNRQLMAFWAPFLLIHLGGPDAITAYSLEDNELWLRYLGKFAYNTTTTVYIYCLALTGSDLSIMGCVVILIGFVKYGERILCLYVASRERLRHSLMAPPDLGYPILIERYQLKQRQGYDVSMDTVRSELQIPEALIDDPHEIADDEDQDIIVATEMFTLIKCLFAGLIRNSNDFESSKELFKKLNPERAFRIVEIELLFMYELLYNKVILLSGYWGAASRISSVALLIGLLVVFKLEDKTMYTDKFDVAATYLLLVSSVVIDMLSTLRLISTDWIKSKRIQRPENTSSKILRTLDILPTNLRWSRQVPQLSLVDLSLNGPWMPPLPIVSLVEKVYTHFAVKYEPFSNYMKDWIYEHVKGKLDKMTDSGGSMYPQLMRDQGWRSMWRSMFEQYQATTILQKADGHPLTWSTEDIDFDQSILIWHIATEICYYDDWKWMDKREGDAKNNYRMSLFISRYMLYLLVINPAILPVGIGQLRYADALIDGRKYFKEQSILKKNSDHPCPSHKEQQHCEGDQKFIHACQKLLQRVAGVPTSIFEKAESKSEMLSACSLSRQLNDLWDKNDPQAMAKKWETIAGIWAEALLYAAARSSGTEHATRLSIGGELLSHVWILMAHFGMSNNIRISQGNVVTKIRSQ